MERAARTYDREQELALATEIETRSVALWTALLAHPATAAVVARLTDERRPERLHELDVDHALADEVVALIASSRAPALVEQRGAITAAAREVADARHRFVEANLGLVSFVASRYRSTTLSREDLIQEGTLGLMKAVDRFDHRRGLRFSTFATWWIRNHVARAVLEGGRVVRVPASANAGAVREVRLDAPLGDHDGQTRIDVFVDPRPDQPHVTDALDYQTLAGAVREVLSSLTAIEREVVERRFGLVSDDEREESLREIASDKGLSHERIRQIEAKALRKLRETLVPMVGEPHLAA